MSVMTIECNYCGSKFTGPVGEAIGWDNIHSAFCEKQTEADQ